MQINNRLKEIAVSAGNIIKKNFHLSHRYETKTTEYDPVTAIDIEVENFLKDKLSKLILSSEFLSEETDSDFKNADKLWIIDPIDGTVNFLHGFPFVCTSIALQIDGIIVKGIVYNPILDELFFAERNQGSTLNGMRINVSKQSDFKSCLLATGFPYAYNTLENNNLKYFDHFHQKVHGIRRAGSAALDLCYVASGIFDGYWEQYLRPWDVAAGKLIVEEAGGIVTNFKEGFSLKDNTIIASNPVLHAEMKKEIDYIGNEYEYI